MLFDDPRRNSLGLACQTSSSSGINSCNQVSSFLSCLGAPVFRGYVSGTEADLSGAADHYRAVDVAGEGMAGALNRFAIQYEEKMPLL